MLWELMDSRGIRDISCHRTSGGYLLSLSSLQVLKEHFFSLYKLWLNKNIQIQVLPVISFHIQEYLFTSKVNIQDIFGGLFSISPKSKNLLGHIILENSNVLKCLDVSWQINRVGEVYKYTILALTVSSVCSVASALMLTLNWLLPFTLTNTWFLPSI